MVSACIATRGDVDMASIIKSIPSEWELLIWNNGARRVEVRQAGRAYRALMQDQIENLGPHGRFAAIHFASNDLIYVQDDDVEVSDPQEIVDRLLEEPVETFESGFQWPLVANMPPEFRPHYPDSCMVGFGAAFHRDAPEMAFRKFFARHPEMNHRDPLFLRESCRIFTTLTPRVLVDVPKVDSSYASDPGRLWKQPGHIEMRDRALAMAREAR